MNKTDKIQIIGLSISAIILMVCLVVGVRIKANYPVNAGLHIEAREPYQVKVYEDGSHVVQYHESQETETGCLKWGLCND